MAGRDQEEWESEQGATSSQPPAEDGQIFIEGTGMAHKGASPLPMITSDFPWRGWAIVYRSPFGHDHLHAQLWDTEIEAADAIKGKLEPSSLRAVKIIVDADVGQASPIEMVRQLQQATGLLSGLIRVAGGTAVIKARDYSLPTRLDVTQEGDEIIIRAVDPTA